MAVGSAYPRVLGVDAVVGNDGAPPAAAGDRRPEAWFERVHIRTTSRISSRRSTRISPGRQRSSSISTGSGTRMGRIGGSSAAVVALKRRRASQRPHRGLAHRYDRADHRPGEASQRRRPRFADRAVQPRRLRRGPGTAARGGQAAAASAAVSRCSISTSIASRSSTTASATSLATSCSSPSRAGSNRACGREMPLPVSAVTNSPFS